MASKRDHWFDAYEQWQADCLVQYNERFGENRTLFVAPEDGDYDPCDLVEFAEDGDAYPHGYGGTGHIRKAVTPWEDSPHYLPIIH